MSKNIVLITLIENYKVTVDDVALSTEIPVEELEHIKNGRLPITIKYAEKLGEYFKVKPELFFMEQSETTHINYGNGSSSNSGYLQNDGTLYYIDKFYKDEELVSRLTKEVKALKGKLSKFENGK